MIFLCIAVMGMVLITIAAIYHPIYSTISSILHIPLFPQSSIFHYFLNPPCSTISSILHVMARCLGLLIFNSSVYLFFGSWGNQMNWEET